MPDRPASLEVAERIRALLEASGLVQSEQEVALMFAQTLVRYSRHPRYPEDTAARAPVSLRAAPASPAPFSFEGHFRAMIANAMAAFAEHEQARVTASAG